MCVVSVHCVVVVLKHAMLHSCNRDDCEPNNVNGPKTNCIKCGNLCFLKCFGFVPVDKINGQDAVKWKVSENNVLYVLVSQFAFVCCSNSVAQNTLKKH